MAMSLSAVLNVSGSNQVKFNQQHSMHNNNYHGKICDFSVHSKNEFIKAMYLFTHT